MTGVNNYFPPGIIIVADQYLPKKAIDRLQIHIYHITEQFDILPKMTECYLRGSIGDPLNTGGKLSMWAENGGGRLNIDLWI